MQTVTLEGVRKDLAYALDCLAGTLGGAFAYIHGALAGTFADSFHTLHRVSGNGIADAFASSSGHISGTTRCSLAYAGGSATFLTNGAFSLLLSLRRRLRWLRLRRLLSLKRKCKNGGNCK